MPADTASDESIHVLAERMTNFLAGQSRVEASLLKVESRLESFVEVQIAIAKQGQQLTDLSTDMTTVVGDKNLLAKRVEELNVDVKSNKKAWAVVMTIAVAFPGAIAFAGLKWAPWAPDIQIARDALGNSLAHYQDGTDKFKFDVGQELRKDDNRLTLLEFRANNIDSKGSK